jgi:hypothetical protein
MKTPRTERLRQCGMGSDTAVPAAQRSKIWFRTGMCDFLNEKVDRPGPGNLIDDEEKGGILPIRFLNGRGQSHFAQGRGAPEASRGGGMCDGREAGGAGWATHQDDGGRAAERGVGWGVS